MKTNETKKAQKVLTSSQMLALQAVLTAKGIKVSLEEALPEISKEYEKVKGTRAANNARYLIGQIIAKKGLPLTEEQAKAEYIKLHGGVPSTFHWAFGDALSAIEGYLSNK